MWMWDEFGQGSSLNVDEGVHSGHLCDNCIKTAGISGRNSDDYGELLADTWRCDIGGRILTRRHDE